MKHLSPAEIETIRVPEPKHDPFSLESLVAWLERQPADGAYDWMDCNGNCLIGQFVKSQGAESWTTAYLRFTNIENRQFIAEAEPHTFGAALTRARAALASQKGNAIPAARTQGSE